MLKSTELRQGNLVEVLYRGLPRRVPVAQIQREGVFVQMGLAIAYYPEAQLEPIELITETLVRNGFTPCRKDHGMEMWDHGDNIGLFLSYGDQIETTSYHAPVAYVHQLQNWYFLIFGQELEVKL